MSLDSCFTALEVLKFWPLGIQIYLMGFCCFLDQRVTGFCVSLLVGLSILLSSWLRLIPASVIFGVFLYLGIASLSGIDFFDRVWLIFMPQKHHPNVSYVRHVSFSKKNWNFQNYFIFIKRLLRIVSLLLCVPIFYSCEA